MYTSIFGVIVNIACAAIFVVALGVGIQGLALASAISSNAIAVALMIMINKRRPGIINLEFLVNILKILISGAAAFAVSKLIYVAIDPILGSGTILTLVKLCIAAAPACVVYLILSWILGVTEIKTAREKLLKRD